MTEPENLAGHHLYYKVANVFRDTPEPTVAVDVYHSTKELPTRLLRLQGKDKKATLPLRYFTTGSLELVREGKI